MKKIVDAMPTAIEQFKKRMDYEQRRIEYKHVPPTKGGVMACPKYNGNWLLVDDIRRVNEERRIAQIPLGCGRNVCSYCGEINRRRFYVELVEGYKRVIAENPNMVLDLLTVTFRTKPASMTWKQWVARNDFTDEEIEDIEATMKRAEEWDAYNLYKLIYEYWEMGPKWIIYARHAMSPRQWSRYISICMKTLWFYWKEKLSLIHI